VVNGQRRELTGWGRACRSTAFTYPCVDQSDVVAALREPLARGVLAHGLGRSYGDQALNGGGSVLLIRQLNRIEAFDPHSGELVCQAGVTLQELVERFLPLGFLPPVSPGTGFVTVAGAVANDVHGKNHESQGSFGRHVCWLDLVVPGGDIVRLSPVAQPHVFAATVGGAGLTGVIVRVCMRLMRVPSNAVRLRERRIANLEEFFAEFEVQRHRAPFSVAWIDALARGAALGRGILETAEPSAVAVATRPPRRLRLPFELPGWVLNSASIAAFNAAYYRRVPASGRERTVGFEHFLYPLDAIGDWNRLYGRRGFYQFQCVIPDSEAPRGIARLLEAVAAERAASFLAVLKTLGAEGEGMLSFPLRGYTLALDFPNRHGTAALLARLETITLDHGGRIYLAKDATLSPGGFRRMYPRLADFERVLDELDPRRSISSDMARRLKIRAIAA
jgi:decaprenylphospho-beta-D-ribofuranose 2-oxidase